MATQEELDEVKELINKAKADIESFITFYEEDRKTTRMYMTEIIKMLTTGQKQVPLVPIELEMQNFRRHREEYWQQKETLLNGIIENYNKISKILKEKVLQN